MGLLTRVFPADVVDAVVAAAGRTEQRQRALPARVVAYFAIGMALYSDGSYEDVFAQLTDGLSWTTGWEQSWSVPTKSAIFQARSRLGYGPLRDLFARVARPVARQDTPGSWLAGRRLVAIDGTYVDVPDTPENADFFGRPPSSRGEQSAFPQARLFAVAASGIGGWEDGPEPAIDYLGSLRRPPRMLSPRKRRRPALARHGRIRARRWGAPGHREASTAR